MSLTQEDVSRIALLSRIELSAAEREATREQLNGILGFIEQLQAVDTAGIEPMAHAVDVVQRLRPDVVTEPTAAPISRPWRRKPRPGFTWCRR
jgi:aspartyl-tRNA(Asn)/glutamyl-tRNA(Gln) amidotransferase subunit C